MDSHHIPDTRKKMTQAYIARWIRPVPAKPFHPHDLSIHLADTANAIPVAHNTGRR